MNFDQTQNATPDATPEPVVDLQDDLADLDPNFVSGGAKKGNRGIFILAGLGVLGAVVIWFTYFRNGPAGASAASSPAGSTEVKQFLDSGNITLMKQTLKSTEKIVQQFRSYPGKTQVPLAALRGNPFRELPPKTQDHVALNPRDEEKEQQEHAAALKAVAELRLQSIFRGKRNACMINNRMYQEGEQLGKFTVAEIGPQAIVLESGKYRFELKMKE